MHKRFDFVERDQAVCRHIKPYRTLEIDLLHRVFFPDASRDRARERLNENVAAGFMGRFEVTPFTFYFVTRKAVRIIGGDTSYTNVGAFSASSMFNLYARALWCHADLDQTSKLPRRPKLTRPEFEAMFSELAKATPKNQHIARVGDTLVALIPIGSTPEGRLLSNLEKTFIKRYLRTDAYRKLVANKRLKLALIVPSKGRQIAIQNELTRRHKKLAHDELPNAPKRRVFELFKDAIEIEHFTELGVFLGGQVRAKEKQNV